jgi:hypothetical protein
MGSGSVYLVSRKGENVNLLTHNLMRLKHLWISVFFLGAFASSQAQGFKPDIAVRKVVQNQRIKSGIRSGELTPREARTLHRQQLRLRKLENRLKADGDFTRSEHDRLRTKQRQASATIYRQKHDRQRS